MRTWSPTIQFLENIHQILSTSDSSVSQDGLTMYGLYQREFQIFVAEGEKYNHFIHYLKWQRLPLNVEAKKEEIRKI